MMSSKLQNHTNRVVGKHGIQTFKDVVVLMLVLLLFDVYVFPNANPLLYFQWVVCPYTLQYQLFRYEMSFENLDCFIRTKEQLQWKMKDEISKQIKPWQCKWIWLDK